MSQHVLPGEFLNRIFVFFFRHSVCPFPALHAFAPSIIFISAGFDAADGDENNYGMCDATAQHAVPSEMLTASFSGHTLPLLTLYGLQVSFAPKRRHCAHPNPPLFVS